MANELIVFPDAVAVIRSGLLARLPELGYPSTRVVEIVPTPRPSDPFVRLMRTGGPGASLVIDRAMVTVETWAENPTDAADLAQAVRAVINAMPGTTIAGVPVYRVVEFSGPATTPDPISGTPRMSWTVEVSMRGNAA